MLLFCFVLGLVIGLFISISKTSFLGLINIKNKTIINIINGTAPLLSGFWDCFISFLMPLVFIFLLSLNFYLNYLNFVLFVYQSMLLFLTSIAIIQSYSFLGFLKIFLVVLPVNILYFFIMVFWIVVCTKRVNISHRCRVFSEGFNEEFKIKIYICLISILFLALVVGFVLPMILKTAIFLIY